MSKQYPVIIQSFEIMLRLGMFTLDKKEYYANLERIVLFKMNVKDKSKLSKVDQRHLLKICSFLAFEQQNKPIDFIDFKIVENRNMRYDKAKIRSGKVHRIGVTNDTIKGYPIKIKWLEII
jgi:hypothetical protein